jgi:hypothetical protein
MLVDLAILHRGGLLSIFEIDFEAAVVIEKNMRFRLLRSLITYAILMLYVFIPMLDSMVCADCIGSPFQSEATIGHLQTSHDDETYASHDGTQSKAFDDQDAKSFCSICANVLMGAELFASNLQIIVVPHDCQHAVPALAELHYSINKPPQNLLA